MDYNPEELMGRIRSLERGLGETAKQADELTGLVSRLRLEDTESEKALTRASELTYGHQNLLRNGDLDHHRNTMYYDPDYSGPATVDADVSEEAADWYTHPMDVSAESTGTMPAADNTLTLDTADFVAGDAGKEITVAGAGPGGADLVTTIASYTSATEVELTAPSVGAVSGARVRWRLQTLTEDTTDGNPDANEATNTALKTSSHSRYNDSGIINNPDYDRVNGNARTSSTNTIDAPFSDNFIKASRQYFVNFTCRLNPRVADAAITASTATLTSATAGFVAGDVGKLVSVAGAGASGADLETTIAGYNSSTSVTLAAQASTTVTNAEARFEAIWDTTNAVQIGIFDNTPGQQKYLEGENTGLTGRVVGSPAATTSRDYFVVALANWDDTISMGPITVAGAPANGHFGPTTYVLLEWTAIVGVRQYQVYRKTGAQYDLIKIVYPGNSYIDTNVVYSANIGGYPAAAFTRARALIRSTDKNFKPGGNWRETKLNLPIPSTYNRSKTTGKQWFRMGLTKPLVGAGMSRAMEFDLISIDDKYGQFTRHPLDFNNLRPSALTAAQSTQGLVGTGDATPIIPGGFSHCPTFDMMVRVEHFGKVFEMSAIDLYSLFEEDQTVRIVTRLDVPVRIESMKIHEGHTVYKLITQAGLTLTASDTQPIFSEITSSKTKKLKNLTYGDKIQTIGGSDIVAHLVRQTHKRSVIAISIEGPEKGYWINGIASSNRKRLEDEFEEGEWRYKDQLSFF